MDALFVLGMISLFFGVSFAILLSPKGQKWINEY